MMKRAVTLLIAVLLVLGCSIPAFAKTYYSSDYVHDGANLIPEEDEYRLSLKVSGYSGQYEASIVVVTQYDSDDLKADAKRFYTDNSHRESGVLLLYSLEDNEAYILTVGACNDAINTEKQDELFDLMSPHIKSENYLSAFDIFAEYCSIYLDNFIAENGALSEYEQNGLFFGFELKWYYLLAAALFLGVVIGFVSVMVMRSKLRSVKYKSMANNYIMDDTMRITREGEIFLYRTTSKRRRPKANSHGRSGGGGGMRFGGSSRKF